MKQNELYNSLERCPIIASVHKDEFDKALTSPVEVVFYMDANLLNIEQHVKSAHEAKKHILIHIDLAEGIGKDEYGIKFAKEQGVDGIISTRTALIKHAKSQGLLAVQRFFVLDSHSVGTIVESAKTSKADMIELMPGTVTKVIEKIKTILDTPIVAGGLIETKEEIAEAYNSGAVAVSTGRESLWN